MLIVCSSMCMVFIVVLVQKFNKRIAVICIVVGKVVVYKHR